MRLCARLSGRGLIRFYSLETKELPPLKSLLGSFLTDSLCAEVFV